MSMRSSRVGHLLESRCPSAVLGRVIQTDLPDVNQAMDDASPATIEKLVQIADELVARDASQFNDAVVALLESRSTAK